MDERDRPRVIEAALFAGPAWVALEYLLREGDEMALADKVAGVVQQRRMEMY